MSQRILDLHEFFDKYPFKNQRNDFCCQDIYQQLLEQEVALYYNDTLRSFGIKILDGGTSYQQITYCPWCGNKLPKDVRDKFFDIIYDELNLDGPDDPKLPEEFKSREWWVKRGL
ncbi:MAG: hypothetical protein KF820_08020 [Candidatus Paracaedibacteraceae bacterium]|nr:hypothetical protein [Candidatus Paracaedibacteraceae bacterium]